MSTNQRVTRSMGRGTGPSTPRGPPRPRTSGTTPRFRTPPRTTRQQQEDHVSVGSTPTVYEPEPTSREGSDANQDANTNSGAGMNEQQPNQPESTSTEEATSNQQQAEQSDGITSRPPNPNANWTGFAPPPDFQQAREEQRERNESNDEASNRPSYRELFNRSRIVAMEPMMLNNDFYLDYRDSQNVKFFQKGREKLSGEAFSGKNLFSWLRRFELRATEFHWMSTLTIEGKSLLTHFAQITMKKVKLHAKELQEEGQRRAQNSRMMLYCITASVTEAVMDKLSLKQHLYTLQVKDEPVKDGVLFLKVLIDSYYASTRYTTTEIRKQLAALPNYMISVARGDVSKLCEHTRKLNTELESAGEHTLDLISNLLAALEKAPNKRFRNWLERKKDQWDMKEIEWKDDGSDLMDQVEA
jgi:hypothetical protein